MKHFLQVSLLVCLFPFFAQAQNLSQLIVKGVTFTNGMSPLQCTPTFLIKDDVNGFARVRLTCSDNVSTNTEYLQDFGLWKSAKGTFVGSYIVHYEAEDMLKPELLTPIFYTAGKDDETVNLYDNEAVLTLFRSSLDKLQAKGAEGSETLYAEIPQKGTTIKLYIVLGSELKTNKGIPKWKMPFGELRFDKTIGEFYLIAL